MARRFSPSRGGDPQTRFNRKGVVLNDCEAQRNIKLPNTFFKFEIVEPSENSVRVPKLDVLVSDNRKVGLAVRSTCFCASFKIYVVK